MNMTSSRELRNVDDVYKPEGKLQECVKKCKKLPNDVHHLQDTKDLNIVPSSNFKIIKCCTHRYQRNQVKNTENVHLGFHAGSTTITRSAFVSVNPKPPT